MIVGCWCQILLFEIYRVSCQILDVICAFNYENGWPNSNQIDVKSSGVQASCFQIFWCNIQNIPQICFQIIPWGWCVYLLYPKINIGGQINFGVSQSHEESKRSSRRYQGLLSILTFPWHSATGKDPVQIYIYTYIYIYIYIYTCAYIYTCIHLQAD